MKKLFTTVFAVLAGSMSLMVPAHADAERPCTHVPNPNEIVLTASGQYGPYDTAVNICVDGADIVVDGSSDDDTFSVDASSTGTVINGGAGNDRFTNHGAVGSTFNGDEGSDDFVLYGGVVVADGGLDPDTANVEAIDACASTCPLSDITMIGGSGGDTLVDESGVATLALIGGDGTDTIRVSPPPVPSSSALAFAASVRSVTVRGGSGNDRIADRVRGSVLYGGLGYDVCRIVKNVEQHGCEKVVYL